MAGKTLDDEDLIHHLAEEEEEEDVEEEEEHADSYTYGRAMSHPHRLGRRLINADEADGEVGDYRPPRTEGRVPPHVLKRG